MSLQLLIKGGYLTLGHRLVFNFFFKCHQNKDISQNKARATENMQEVTEKKETLALRVTKILNKEDRQHKKM